MCSQYVGVDWSSGEWVSIAYTDESESPSVAVFEEITEVWDHYSTSARCIVVDVPIGLCESLESDACSCVEEDGELSRHCDDLARNVIGSQYRSVFTAPAREAAKLAAAGADHSEISDKNEELTGKRLTQQAAGIAEGIVEVENLLLGDGDPEVLVEGHPEVCFRALSGTPLEHSKHTAVGIEERLSVLESVPKYEAGDWRTIARELRSSEYRVGLDDVLDAFALALTACASHEEFRRLPSDPPTDASGLPMQMVYRNEMPLEK
ncbi:DUF429 domain-containing protein [Natronorubrum thiooxidans]|uniref:Predicted nuclease (RNAse H fold) n=1 Tax=Natronorubrum thiooxidans TaxID=308853 RepID=A0A1N7HAL1_9EURY|nr:DUF429 domain-containing protein [Natronorubrum thiooxidans]SIS21907.1 Predicted nuclease (RNAse H fold) [Natronorubrum thiooxidans]